MKTFREKLDEINDAQSDLICTKSCEKNLEYTDQH